MAPQPYSNFFKSLLYSLWLILLFGLINSVTAQVVVQSPSVSGTDSIYDNHVSNIISIGADSLLITWFGGELEGETDNVIYLKRSYNRGRTWLQRDSLFYGAGDTLYRDPHLFRWRDTIFLIFNRQIGAGSILRATESRLLLSHSTDEGVTWSTPKTLNPGGVASGLSIRIVAPFNDPVEINNKPVFGIHWREVGQSSPHVSLLILDFANDTSYLTGDLHVNYRIVEPALLQNNGVLHLYLRNDQQFIQYSTSQDSGQTWSTPVNTKLVCSYSLSSVKQIASDSILVVWNDHRSNRDYLSVGLCQSYDLSDLYWKQHIDFRKSTRGQVSYPASLIFSSDSIGISYTDRMHLGFKPDGKLDLRGSIKYIWIKPSERNDLAAVRAASDSISRPFLLNKINEVERGQYVVLANKAVAEIVDSNFQALDTLDLDRTPYDLTQSIYDSASSQLHILGKGGWYMKYDVSNDLVTHQKRFDSIGAWNIQDAQLRDSTLYFVNLNGDLAKISDPDSAGLKLLKGNRRAKHRILGDSLMYFLSDSLGVQLYDPSTNGLSNVHISPSAYAAYLDGVLLGDTLLIAVGDRGALGFFSSTGQKTQELLSGSYNLRSCLALNDSVIFISTDRDLAVILALRDTSVQQLKYLPKSQHGLGLIDQGPILLWYTEEGGIYRLSKQELISWALAFTEVKFESMASLFYTYPQPYNDSFVLEATEPLKHIKVLSMNGQLLYQEELDMQMKVRLVIPDLVAGKYILQVTSAQGQQSSAILIKTN